MMKARVVRVLLVAVVGVAAWCVGVGGAVGAPGDLDTSFSTDGMVMTDIGGSTDYGGGVVVDSAGRVIVAGYSDNGSTYDFAVVRYTSAGVLDTSFGTDGKVTTAIGTSNDGGYAVVVDSAGRIVVAGSSDNGSDDDFAVVRYTSSGVLDTSFGTGGKVTTDIGSSSDTGLAVAVDSAGRIVVAGYSYNGSDLDFAVVRYTSAGVLDTTFGTDGKLTTAIGTGNDYGLAVDSAGKIVVAGHSNNGSDEDIAVVRYTSSGVLDTTFGTDGKVTTAIGTSYDTGQTVAVDSDDRIVVAGSSYNGSDNDFAVVRYTSSGVLDTTFGTGGKVTTAIGSGSDSGRGVVVDSAGRIVVAGYSDNGSDNDFAVVRYLGASLPGAPAELSGVSGDGEIALSWMVPSVTGGAAVTDYVVEYSSDGGVSWSTFSDGVSTDTDVTVTGLSNGVGYVFRVSAVNSAGTGAVSVVLAEVAPWWAAPAGCTIVGTPDDDVLVGTGGADHICGLGGNDKIYGKSGNDVLDGGPGNDKLFGGKGKDVLDGGKGNDVLKGGKGKDTLYGRGGADVLKGGPGNDKLYGNGGRDKLYGQAGNDRLVGGSNRDKLYGNGGRDKLFGGKARDLLVGGAKKDKLYGGKGKDKAKKPGPDVLVSIEIVVP
jgi:uncharacterized delta-60 repeat protein